MLRKPATIEKLVLCFVSKHPHCKALKIVFTIKVLGIYVVPQLQNPYTNTVQAHVF